MRAGIRSIALAAALATTIAPTAALAEDPAVEAKAALSSVLGEISATARDENLSADQKRALIEHELAIWIDYGHMSAVALGSRAELFSSQELAEFYQEFERYLSDVYIRRIVRFRENEIEIKQASLDEKTGIVMVRTLGGAPLGAFPGLATRRMWKERADVDYLLREKRGEWRIIAIRIDGVDTARVFRDQFQAVLGRSDPDALIADLRKRNAEREAKNPFDQ
jgi:ABC-type transporter MlaC component